MYLFVLIQVEFNTYWTLENLVSFNQTKNEQTKTARLTADDIHSSFSTVTITLSEDWHFPLLFQTILPVQA